MGTFLQIPQTDPPAYFAYVVQASHFFVYSYTHYFNFISLKILTSTFKQMKIASITYKNHK